jgi:subtilase family serine protease
MLGSRSRFAARASSRRRCWLRLEQLEDRQLLSASRLADIVVPLLTDVVPLGNNGFSSALNPLQVRHAYSFDQLMFWVNGLPIKGDGYGQVIAIVDAYDHPTIAGDLVAFSNTFGLPNAGLIKAMPQGQPAADKSWALETALDVEWAHAMAPRATILLVEAKTSSMSNMVAAVDYARHQPGVVAVSMSWGSSEFSAESYYDSVFTTPAGHVGGWNLPGGVSFVASSGDTGAVSIWPNATNTCAGLFAITFLISSV